MSVFYAEAQDGSSKRATAWPCAGFTFPACSHASAPFAGFVSHPKGLACAT